MKNFVCALALIACSAGIFSTAYAERSHQEQTIRTVWSVDVDQRLPNTPVALSAPAFVQHGDDVWAVIGGRDGWVHVYNQATGSEISRFSLGAASDSPALALDNGFVVLGDIRGNLFVVDPVEGNIVWQKQLTASYTSTPLLVGNDFIVQTTDNALYRFSANGEKRWSFSGTNSTLSMYLGATPLVAGDHVYALLSNGDALALKAYTGDLVWKRQLLLSSASSALTDLKAPLATPLLVSKLHMNGEQVSNVLLMPFFQGELIALSVIDGSQAFSLPTSLKSSPLVQGATMYMADSSGFLHAYNTEKGNRMWSKKISENALMGPVFWQDSLWISDSKGGLYRLDTRGETQDSTQFRGSIARKPIVTDKGILIRTDRGEMVMVH